jgi:hypothetical protein
LRPAGATVDVASGSCLLALRAHYGAARGTSSPSSQHHTRRNYSFQSLPRGIAILLLLLPLGELFVSYKSVLTNFRSRPRTLSPLPPTPADGYLCSSAMAAPPPPREGSDKPIWHMEWEVCGKVSAKDRRGWTSAKRSNSSTRNARRRNECTARFHLLRNEQQRKEWRNPASTVPPLQTQFLPVPSVLLSLSSWSGRRGSHSFLGMRRRAPTLTRSHASLPSPSAHARITTGPRGMVPEVHSRESASTGLGGVVHEHREWNGEGGGGGTS